MDGTSAVTLASLSSIATGIATVAEWFFGIFTKFIGIIAANDLILWPVILAFTVGAISLVILVIRKFGLKGKR